MKKIRCQKISCRVYSLGVLAGTLALGNVTTAAWAQTSEKSVLSEADYIAVVDENGAGVAAYPEVSLSTQEGPVFSSRSAISESHAQLSSDSERSEAVAEQPAVQAPTSAIAREQVEILNPAVGTVLDVPAATVIIRFPTGAEIQLQANGEPVDTQLIGRTETDSETSLVTQSWYGVNLVAGENVLSVMSADGLEELATTTIEVRGTPTTMEVRTRESSVPADGRSTATVQGRLLDENNNLSNWSSVVTLTASDGEFIGADYNPDQSGFQVQVNNGVFTAELQSPLEAKIVQLYATTTGDLEAYNQVQFETPYRPSIATGVVDLRFGARGTDYYSSFRDFLPLDEDNGYELDLSAAAFATGNIGEWLFTGAVNSDRALNEDCRGESGVFSSAADSCNALYPTYGDDSNRNAIAPSQDRLYLRFERTSDIPGSTPDYAMWGDFHTREFATSSQLFTGLNRQLHGFKLNYNLGNLAATGFYGDNIEGFQRDTIAPDGTSGLYFLSRRLILPGTETITIELEELDRPGTVIERQQLFRTTDYDIDYDRGTIIFNDSIPQTTVGDFGEILVRQIVATYQFENQGSDTNIIAGRLQYNLDRSLESGSWLATSYVRENQGNRDFELYGVDGQIAFGDSGQLIAEYANSSNDFDLSGPISGSAYRVELEGDVDDWLSGRAYWRSTDSGFSNAATTSFVPGQTRYGAQADFQVGETTKIRAQFDHEDNNGVAPRPLTSLADLVEPGSAPIPGQRVDNSLTTYSLGLSQQFGDTDLEFDWIHRDRTDRLTPDVLSVSSDQLRTRLTSRLTDRVTLRAQNELNLSSGTDPLSPSRTLFGIDWEFMPGLSLGVNQIFYGGDGINDRNSLTSIDFSGEQNLGPDTTIRGRFSSIEGQRVGGAIGLEQGFNLGPGLRLDLGYERAFNTISGTTAAGSQFIQPFAVGTGASGLATSDANTYTVGLSYTDNPDLQASARFEHRTSSQGSNTVLDANVVGRLSPSLSTLFNYQYADTANQSIRNLGATSQLKLGLAYRDPNEDKINALVRYEHRLNPGSIPVNATFGTTIDTAEHLFSAETLYTPNWRWELYGKYAFRNSSTSISRPADVGGDFTSSNSLHLAQLRATYRFDYHWDVTGELRWIGGIGNYGETGYALEAGFYPTPDLRMYAGYSGGGANDRDLSVNRSAGGFYLGVAAKINSLFDGFGLQNVVPSQHRESQINTADEAEESNDSEVIEQTDLSLEEITDEPLDASSTEAELVSNDS
ncbi:MAG: TonB-dependent receptor [Cyanobacteria bacterium P01_D01_bin.56]